MRIFIKVTLHTVAIALFCVAMPQITRAEGGSGSAATSSHQYLEKYQTYSKVIDAVSAILNSVPLNGSAYNAWQFSKTQVLDIYSFLTSIVDMFKDPKTVQGEWMFDSFAEMRVTRVFDSFVSVLKSQAGGTDKIASSSHELQIDFSVYETLDLDKKIKFIAIGFALLQNKSSIEKRFAPLFTELFSFLS